MKIIAVPLALLLAASVLSAQTPAPAAKPATTKTTPAKPVDPKAVKKDEKKKEKEPVIPGTNIARPNGTWLGLEVVGGQFVLKFYDTKKKAMAPDVTRATARWPNPRAPGDNRTVLNNNGSGLVGSKPVIPPYNFNVFLTLLQGEGDGAKAVENYTVQLR